MKREAWTDLVDLGKLSKFSNVFNRLKADKKLYLLEKIKEDPREANKIANTKISFHNLLADKEDSARRNKKNLRALEELSER